jgi:hypothetical protein
MPGSFSIGSISVSFCGFASRLARALDSPRLSPRRRSRGECSPPPTAVFFAVPGTMGNTTTSTVAEPPLGRSPKTHWTALE